MGAATPDLVERVFRSAVAEVGSEVLGAHLHIHPLEGMEKSKQRTEVAAFEWTAPCEEWVDALRTDDLVGNAPTEWVVDWAEKEHLWKVSNASALDQSLSLAADLFA